MPAHILWILVAITYGPTQKQAEVVQPFESKRACEAEAKLANAAIKQKKFILPEHRLGMACVLVRP